MRFYLVVEKVLKRPIRRAISTTLKLPVRGYLKTEIVIGKKTVAVAVATLVVVAETNAETKQLTRTTC